MVLHVLQGKGRRCRIQSSMDIIMLKAPRAVDVPKGFADEVLHLAIFFGTFVSDSKVFHMSLFRDFV